MYYQFMNKWVKKHYGDDKDWTALEGGLTLDESDRAVEYLPNFVVIFEDGYKARGVVILAEESKFDSPTISKT